MPVLSGVAKHSILHDGLLTHTNSFFPDAESDCHCMSINNCKRTLTCKLYANRNTHTLDHTLTRPTLFPCLAMICYPDFSRDSYFGWSGGRPRLSASRAEKYTRTLSGPPFPGSIMQSSTDWIVRWQTQISTSNIATCIEKYSNSLFKV